MLLVPPRQDVALPCDQPPFTPKYSNYRSCPMSLNDLNRAKSMDAIQNKVMR